VQRGQTRYLVHGTLSLERDDPAGDPHQRQAPPREPVQGGQGAGYGDVVRGLRTRKVLGAGTDHGDARGEAEVVHDLGEEGHAPGQGLQQRHRARRQRQRQRDAGQPGAAPDVDDAGAGHEQGGDDGAVQEVAVPEAVGLTGTEEPAFDTGPGEPACVPLGEGEEVAEEGAPYVRQDG
jgi:hypothetical protein